jgi:hypothetical protein
VLTISSAPQSTESSIRYAAYATRIRTALLSAQRYVAYTSDIGESFRPVAHPNLVRAAYGISWAYIAGDVAHEGYKAYCSNQRTLHPELPREASQVRYNDAKSDLGEVASDAGVSVAPGKVTPLNDYRTVMAQRAIFQSIASMGLVCLPFFQSFNGEINANRRIASIHNSQHSPLFQQSLQRIEKRYTPPIRPHRSRSRRRSRPTLPLRQTGRGSGRVCVPHGVRACGWEGSGWGYACRGTRERAGTTV